MTIFLQCTIIFSFLMTGPISAQPAQVVPGAATPLPSDLLQPVVRTIKVKILQKGSGTPIRKVEVRFGDIKTFSDPEGAAIVEIPAKESEISFVKTGYLASSLPWEEVKNLAELISTRHWALMTR